MKFFLLVILSLGSLGSYALDAYFKHNVFHNSKNEPYVEMSILFNGTTMSYGMVEAGFQSQVELTYSFEQDGKLIDWSKTIVKSPISIDTVNEIRDFLDFQRFALPYGTYDLTIVMVDIFNSSDTSRSSMQINVEAPKTEAFFSDIMLVQSYSTTLKKNTLSRGNIDIIPRVSKWFGPLDSTLTFYSEFYHSESLIGSNENYIVTTQIINSNSKAVLENNKSFIRKKSNSLDVTFKTIDIKNVYSGNYILRLEARDKNNEVFASRDVEFDRVNNLSIDNLVNEDLLQKSFVMNINAKDSLREMVYCLRPRVSTMEKDYIDKNWKEGDTTELRGFLFGYWFNENNLDPESSYKEYMVDVNFVRENFGPKNISGCGTPRGRVYLQYGKPNTRVVQPYEPNAYPYEIWHYYETKPRRDAKFAFFNRSLGFDYYELMHSNVPGEYKDDQWYMRISSRNESPSGNDEPISGGGEVMYSENLRGANMNSVGSRALDFWNNPR